MTTEWIEYQVMRCDAAGCPSSAREEGGEWAIWTVVRGSFPSDDKHYCPIHKPVGEERKP